MAREDVPNKLSAKPVYEGLYSLYVILIEKIFVESSFDKCKIQVRIKYEKLFYTYWGVLRQVLLPEN